MRRTLNEFDPNQEQCFGDRGNRPSKEERCSSQGSMRDTRHHSRINSRDPHLTKSATTEVITYLPEQNIQVRRHNDTSKVSTNR